MSLTDPIADMATKIRNASSAGKDKVDVKASVVTENILKILKDEAFIEDYKKVSDERQGTLRVYLKFSEDSKPYITNIKRISKPGLRVYRNTDDIRSVFGGLGIAIISTSQGILSGKEARDKRLGGEIMLEVW
jgi:small subunit ribosomal protein S8